MQLQKLFAITLSVASLGIAGCNQTQDLNAQAQPSAQTTNQTPASPIETQTPAPSSEAPEREPDVPYVPTPNEVVVRMLELAKVQKDDVLYDLGSGDGRIVITAAQKYGTREIGRAHV